MKLSKNRIKELPVWSMILVTMLQFSCRKDWLDAKSSKSLVVPSEYNDFQAMLDNTNQVFNGAAPALGELGTDEYYIPDQSVYDQLQPVEKDGYIWQRNNYNGNEWLIDWNRPYMQVYYCNVILEGLNKFTPSVNDYEYNNIKGQALFFRSFAFFGLAETFSKPYSKATATNDMGIPLRLSTEITKPESRATVEDTYKAIVSDLKEAARILPEAQVYKSRPSKPAAFGMLARVHLAMNDYVNALLYADSCLRISNTLIDYNTIDAGSLTPFQKYNEEVMFYNIIANYNPFSFWLGYYRVDSLLYKSYPEDDLRKQIYFTNYNDMLLFKGSYGGTGVGLRFNGIVADEVYLVKAESLCRLGNTDEAISTLNYLLNTRYKTGTFVPHETADAEEALAIIIAERRKELCFRGLRWSDLRRLNKDPRFSVTLTRYMNGQTYILPPNDARYVCPIPDGELKYNPIPQNPY